MDEIEKIISAIKDFDNRIRAVEDKVNDARIYNTREAAEFLGCTRQTLSKYRKMGIINPITGTTRYTLRELLRVKNRKNL